MVLSVHHKTEINWFHCTKKTETFQFNKTMQDSTDGQGARCNPIIMFLTDGGTEQPVEIFNEYNWPEKPVRHTPHLSGSHLSPPTIRQPLSLVARSL